MMCLWTFACVCTSSLFLCISCLYWYIILVCVYAACSSVCKYACVSYLAVCDRTLTVYANNLCCV